MSNKLLKISSDLCLKTVFSYLEYDYILLLIKYNNKLKNKLEIKNTNYKLNYKFAKIKIYIRRKHPNLTINFLTIAFFLFITIFIVFYILILGSILVKRGVFNDYNTKDLIQNWKSKPIYQIKLLNESNESISIGEFKGIKNKIKKHSFYFWEGKTFKLIYNEDLIYKNLYDKKGKQCGYDSQKNKLFFPNDCPINYIEITNNKNPSIHNLSFTSLKINDLKYIHYTNQYIEGQILINFQIGTDNGICEYKNYDSLSKYFNKYKIKNEGCKNNLYDDSFNVIDKISINNFLVQNNLEEAINYLSSDSTYIYFYKRTYKGYDKINDINFILKNINNIKKINLSLFGFILYMFVSFILIYIIFHKGCYYDLLKTIIIKGSSLIIIIGLFLLYNSFIIWKLYLSYKIKNKLKNISKPLNEIYNKNILWFIICDYFLIIFNFICIIYLILVVIYYFKIVRIYLINYTKIVLTKFKNIGIEMYKLPKNFESMNRKEKQIYLLNHSNEFLFSFSNKIKLIDLINQFRIQNKIEKLEYNEYEKIPDFIIKEPSEMKLFQYKHIFKISNKKYLFKYKINEFQKKFDEKDDEILNILLIKDLNKILIIEYDNFEYILIYEDNDLNHITLDLPFKKFRDKSTNYYEYLYEHEEL